MGTTLLAYSFGLRHANDADHSAAVDKVTDKMMQPGKRPVALGLTFSLGPSPAVFVGSVAIAATALALQHRIDAPRNIGGAVGTLGSSVFLFAIAVVNLIVLSFVCQTFATWVRRCDGDWLAWHLCCGGFQGAFSAVDSAVSRALCCGNVADPTDNTLIMKAYGWA